ncbi:Olfactory receptor 4D2 [Lonchura striata]|uniref:Olfactory receptor 4D2 n=1 Tax=Lonchura striata TaxID=40157 RepID=A0A218U972_9PASE|nr:Olfactory receptor 4D2 [Lonchura striata domestica]
MLAVPQRLTSQFPSFNILDTELCIVIITCKVLGCLWLESSSASIRICIVEGKRKALSTCGTQITVVSLIFIPSIFTYAQPYKKYPGEKVASIVYTVVTPMLNPLIYTLRNAEMKKAIRRTLGKIFLSAGMQKPEQTVDPKTSNLVFSQQNCDHH